MRKLWSTVIDPLLDAWRPASVVELTRPGESLAELLEAATAELGGSFHGGKTTVAGPDLALVHGEPNWYTVTERLTQLGEMAAAGEAPYPLTLVHGIDPPTARRDAYPDPAAVPLAARQAHRDVDGTQRALDAHQLRNGVLTAVEDFVAGREEELASMHVPGLGGIAILVPPSRLDDSSALAEHLGGWRLSPQVLAQMAALEAERMRTAARAARLHQELEAARTGAQAQSSAEREEMRARIEQLVEREAELTTRLARREARLSGLEGGR